MVRFGKITEFGANFNLTGYDMTHHHLPATQLLSQLYLYLFQPMNVSLEFPFLNGTGQQLDIWTPMQVSYGGWFTLFMPGAVILFFIGFLWKRMHALHVRTLSMGMLFVALIICVFNTSIVGYDARYIIDFSWALLFVCVFMLYALDTSAETVPIGSGHAETGQAILARVMNTVVVYGILLSVVLGTLYVLARFSSMNIGWLEAYSWFIML